MKTFETRAEIEAAIDTLLAAGIFRTDCFRSSLSAAEILQIATERKGCEIADAGRGWHVVLSRESSSARALRRIAWLFDTAPYDDLAKAIVKTAAHEHPDCDELYEAIPSADAIRLLLGFLGCDSDHNPDLSRMDDPIEPSELEVRLFDVLSTTLDGCMSACRLVRRIGKAGKRTWFNDRFLPSVPFVLHDRLGPVRPLGLQPIPELHRPQEQGAFVSYTSSQCGRRGMVEYRVSEEAVETASFNVSAAVKILVAGEYREINTGDVIAFRLETKNARKMAGVGRIIRRRYPNYVAGQRAFVILDRDNRTALLKVCDATDVDARRRLERILETGIIEKSAAHA